MRLLPSLYLAVLLVLIGSSKCQVTFPASANGGSNRGGRIDPASRFINSQCGGGLTCRPATRCSSQVANAFRPLKCTLGSSPNNLGICCKDIRRNRIPVFLARPIRVIRVQNPPKKIMSTRNVNKALSFGENIARNVSNLLSSGSRLQRLNRGSSGNSHYKHQKQRNGVAKISDRSIVSSMVAASLTQAISTNSIEVNPPNANSRVRFPGEVEEELNEIPDLPLISTECEQAPSCDRNSEYRRIDGSCNNLNQPKWGQANTALQRILPAEYQDGVFVPRSEGLPSARECSNAMAINAKKQSSELTYLFMSFGQFLDHDIDHTPVARDANGQGIDCCDGPFKRTDLSPEETILCFPISVPQNDRFYRGKKDCIPFVRSAGAIDIDCRPGPLQQVNQLTHWIDASNVYGSAVEETNRLRRFKDGLLRVHVNPDGSELLPDSGDPECRGSSRRCFLAGDSRVNENPNLAVMHTIFMRDHNRIARELKRINPSWANNDLLLFQEARKILIAQWQHVVYNEYLPVLLGNNFMFKFGLFPLTEGYSTDYRDDFDPRISNAFSTAAFRVGHTMIPPFVRISEKLSDGKLRHRTKKLRDLFNDMDVVKARNGVDDLVRGMLIEPAEKIDNTFADDILNHLFEDGIGGLDLIALNIQRGRDHGLPGYSKYREKCQIGNGRAKSFQDLSSNMSPNNIRRLQQMYSKVDDIDLFVGLSLEDSDPGAGAPVGSTFLCLIGDQFAKLKKGDRFFYDLGSGQSGYFKPDQLEEIRKTSLARIICDNVEGIEEIQPLALKVSNAENPLIKCDNTLSIPRVNLEAWKV